MADSYEDAVATTLWKARRVGVDRVVGYLRGGMPAWVTSGSIGKSVAILAAGDTVARAWASVNKKEGTDDRHPGGYSANTDGKRSAAY